MLTRQLYAAVLAWGPILRPLRLQFWPARPWPMETQLRPLSWILRKHMKESICGCRPALRYIMAIRLLLRAWLLQPIVRLGVCGLVELTAPTLFMRA